MAARRHGQPHIGTSGYQYDHWRNVFYPKSLPKKDWFSFYSRQFDTVEINNTFYNLPGKKTFRAWHDQAPESFLYVLKYSRYGSHLKRLKDPQQHVPNFLERAALLKGKLGPILLQLPPHWEVNAGRLNDFLAYAGKHRGLRWAVEFRDPSWFQDEIFQVLREHGAALCIHDMLADHPRMATTDWVYLRFHGPSGHGKYQGSYPHQALVAEAERIHRHLKDRRDVYAYFNNDQRGHALQNAADLRRYVNSR